MPLSTFLDAADQRGIAYDAARAFEEQLDDKLGSGHVKVDVVMIPVARDELISGLIEGYGDIAFGNITITPERAALVDFSDPFLEGVKEIVVTGPDSSALANLDDLGGREAYVRESSSYDQSLTRLNEWLRADGKAQVTLTLAPEVLEDEDLLEMVNAGLVPIVGRGWSLQAAIRGSAKVRSVNSPGETPPTAAAGAAGRYLRALRFNEGGPPVFAAAITLAVAIALLYVGRGYLAWTLAGALALSFWATGAGSLPLVGFALVAFGGAALVLGRPNLRQRWITPRVLPIVAKLLPRLGDTERIALEAGTVWWDGDLFSGRPDWQKLLDFEIQPLSPAEQAFLDGPVEQLCAMLDDWDVQQRGDLPDEVWRFLREQRFFGMIIPEAQGGLGFSAAAHSAVVTKLASRSITAAVTVMVPNSLGPAELLLHYGTEAQQKHYLPRLARGEEIPCFALTGPEAGSDAAATQSEGVVTRGKFEGRDVLGMRLHWRKRYITLGPVATLIGLAFRLRDPERLLGGDEDLGITCALIPARLPGVEIGLRHDPLGVPFQNGPNQGHDVFVPLDFIIGGRERAGQGWRMLMESLAAGRSISLPALSVGGAQLAARVVSAYGMVREQFDTPIGRFEGVEEPLARIGGLTYLMGAARRLIAAAVDDGEKPAVLSAVAKAYLTEGMRAVVQDAMDVRAGAAICRGPRNILARAHLAVPIGITVEGSNILTRSMIIYGQGAIRCHPFALEEIEAVAADDPARFDRAFFGHVNFVFTNAARALVLGLSGGRSERAPLAGAAAPWFGRLTRISAAFALVSDACMATLGGQLKRREKITGRLADVLAWQYLASATLKRFCDAGQPARERAFLDWACAHALHQCQEALAGVLDNLPNRPAAWALRPLVFPLGRRLRPPGDALGTAVARALLDDPEARDALTADIFRPPAEEPGLGRLEAALAKSVAALGVEKKIRDAVRAGALDHAPGDVLADRALEAGLISADERKRIHAADEARDEAIQVDAFTQDEYAGMRR